MSSATSQAPAQVAVLVGSLRKESFSRKIARGIAQRAERRLRCTLLEIGDLPLYNEDLDGTPPPPWQRLRREIRAADAVMLVTPEYNRSVPGVLKNAIDVGSRPQGQNAFDGKPTAVISQTPYKLGAFGANHAVRQSCVYLNMPVLQQPEMYLNVADVLDDSGALKGGDTAAFMDKFIDAFADWIARVGASGRGSRD